MDISELDFRKWYKSEEELKADEDRDQYPPRFITHVKCHRLSTLDVTYDLEVKNDSTIVKKYKISIFVKASHEGDTIRPY